MGINIRERLQSFNHVPRMKRAIGVKIKTTATWQIYLMKEF